MKEYTYDECYIGLRESFTATVTSDMVEKFKEISGDYNPLHNEIRFANDEGFPDKVVYGMLTASFLSTLAGMYLPGKYCLIQEVDAKFAKPVYVGDVLEISGEVVDKNDLFHQLVLKVRIKNQKDENVLRGKMNIGLLGMGV